MGCGRDASLALLQGSACRSLCCESRSSRCFAAQCCGTCCRCNLYCENYSMTESNFKTPPLERKRSKSTRSVTGREDYSPVPKKQLRPIAGRGIAPLCLQAVGSKVKAVSTNSSSPDTSDVAYWWFFVMEFLSVHDAANFGHTSRSHHALFRKEHLWGAFLERDFGIRRTENTVRRSGPVVGRTACVLCAEDLAEGEWRKVLFDQAPVHACPAHWSRSMKSATGVTMRRSCRVDIYSMRRCAAVDLSPRNLAVALRLGPSLHRLYAWCTVCKFIFKSRTQHCPVICADSSEAEWLNANKVQCRSCRRQFFRNTVVSTFGAAPSSQSSSPHWKRHDHEAVGAFTAYLKQCQDIDFDDSTTIEIGLQIEQSLARTSPFDDLSPFDEPSPKPCWLVWEPSPKFFGKPVRISPCRAEVVQCAGCGNHLCGSCSVNHETCCTASSDAVARLRAARMNETCSMRKMR